MKKPRWGLSFHLEQETKPETWRYFETYVTRAKAVAAGRKIVTGRWRVVEVASRIIWVHEPERRKAPLPTELTGKQKTTLKQIAARAETAEAIRADKVETARQYARTVMRRK
jgi:hypothetical protein